ncbi:uncharacterized protein [Periplaneta americana]|uniref:uncharacterized protein n=1 Tax=Periplaneta americana TaxID=6978 RepID=UPI0037E76566
MILWYSVIGEAEQQSNPPPTFRYSNTTWSAFLRQGEEEEPARRPISSLGEMGQLGSTTTLLLLLLSLLLLPQVVEMIAAAEATGVATLADQQDPLFNEVQDRMADMHHGARLRRAKHRWLKRFRIWRRPQARRPKRPGRPSPPPPRLPKHLRNVHLPLDPRVFDND